MSDANWTTVSNLPGVPLDQQMQGAQAKGNNIILFHEVFEKNEFKSAERGAPVLESKIYIKIITPADRTREIDRRMTVEDKEKYKVELANWMKTRENKIPGIPIEHWHGISERQKAEFRAMNIFTVDQFAALDDSAHQTIGPGFDELRRRAKAFIEQGKDAEALAAKNKEISNLQAQLDELRALIEGKTAPEKVSA